MLMASENWAARWQGIPGTTATLPVPEVPRSGPTGNQSSYINMYRHLARRHTLLPQGFLQVLEDVRQAIPAQISMTRTEPPSSRGYLPPP